VKNGDISLEQMKVIAKRYKSEDRCKSYLIQKLNQQLKFKGQKQLTELEMINCLRLNLLTNVYSHLFLKKGVGKDHLNVIVEQSVADYITKMYFFFT